MHELKVLFITGGSGFMGLLTIFFIITLAWFIFHFVIAYNSKEANLEKFLRKLEYGKSLGLFTLMAGLVGQMVGFYGMFDAIADALNQGMVVEPKLVYQGIQVTMIVTFYGIFIYLFSILVWFIGSLIIEKRQSRLLV